MAFNASDSSRESGFCTDCGSILPLLNDYGDIQCYTCKKNYHPEVYKGFESKYVINFNSYTKKHSKNTDEEENEGPVVERKCPQCGNEKMSYATLQLRSADEGQTVFYTCTECKYKETENS